MREITIPSDMTLRVTLVTALASDVNHVEDPVIGRLAKPLMLSGQTVVPEGSELTGSVLEAETSGRVKGKASIAFRFDHVTIRGVRHAIQTRRIDREAASSTKSDVKKGGIGAGVGAIVGGIAGGGGGAAAGAAIGGAGTVLATKGNEVRLPAGTTVTTTLQKDLTVEVPIK